MVNESEIRKVVEKVLKEENLHNFVEVFKKEHNLFRGTHETPSDKFKIAIQDEEPENPYPGSAWVDPSAQAAQGEKGAATFLELTDAPASYANEGEKIVAVKATEDGLEFVTPSEGAVGIPVGSIIAWLGGYFTGAANEGYTRVLGTANTIVAVNALLNGDGWYVCDGALLNLEGSPIFNGAGRYLPKLTDDRFIMGDTLGGTPGGNNAMAHTHGSGTLGTDTEANHGHGDNFSVNNHTLTVAQMPAHSHKFYIKRIASWADNNRDVPSASAGTWFATNSQGGNSGHNHGLSGGVSAGGSHSHSVNSGATDAASNTENRPKFLGCFYIMRAI